MVKRVKISSGTKWEPIVGYSGAVRVGKIVHVSGTTTTDSQGNLVGTRNAESQTTQALTNIKNALEIIGARN